MEVIIATSQSRLETHSGCLVIESCDYESILSSLFSFVFHITSIREIAATQTMTITFQASTLAWKEMPFLLVAFKFATSPRCTPGMGVGKGVSREGSGPPERRGESGAVRTEEPAAGGQWRC